MQSKRHRSGIFHGDAYPVSNTSHGFDMYAFFTQLFPQTSDMRIERPGRRLTVITPHFIHQYFSRQDVSPGAHEFLEQIELLSGQDNLTISYETLPALRVEPDPAYAKQIASRFLDATENRFDSEYKLAWAKGLCDVI